MKQLLAVSGIAAVVVGLVITGPALPQLATDTGLDFWNASELEASIDANVQLQAELDAKFAEAKARIDYKNALVGELAAGRISLPEAAAEFKRLNADRPAAMEIVRSCYPGRTDDECVCRNVIGYLEASVRCNHVGDPAVIDALNSELQRRIDRGESLIAETPNR